MGASMAGQQWKKGGGGDNAERMPRLATARPVFALQGN